MFCALNGNGGSVVAWRKIGREPICEEISRVWAGTKILGVSELNGRNGDRGNLCSVLVCQLTGGSAVTATNIDYFIARFYLRFLHNDVHQASHRNFGAVSPPNPKTMMQMLTPKLSVKGIQFVVVVSYCRLVKGCLC